MSKVKQYPSKVQGTLYKGDKGRVVRDLQDAANVIIDAHRFPWRKVVEDGDLGPATISGLMFAAWLMGLTGKQRKMIKNGRISPRIQRLIRRERKRMPWHLRNKAKRKPKIQRLRKLARNRPVDPDGDGLDTFDGVVVAAWIAYWLRKSREAGWQGSVNSGWRDPVYSEQLCYNMCGRPSCPGKCAGRSSNHSGKGSNIKGDPGAVDVSDYVRFGRIQKEIGSPLVNRLGPADPVHFSLSGK